MFDDREFLAGARRDAQKIVNALNQRGCDLLRDDLVRRYTDSVRAREWIATMSPDVRALFEEVNETVEHYALWAEARAILLEEQREADEGSGDNRWSSRPFTPVAICETETSAFRAAPSM